MGSNHRRLRLGAAHTFLALTALLLPAAPLRAAGTLDRPAPTGCQPTWLATFGNQPGVGGLVRALTVFDDGSGSALYAGGYFRPSSMFCGSGQGRIEGDA
jgi:hypothetical protein